MRIENYNHKINVSLLWERKIHLKNLLTNILFSLVFAILMAISANSFFYLPFTPVPVTMQVFTVLISSIILGSRWAFMSQFWYIIMGISGLPVFAGFKSGIGVLAGPTGGYIIGFLVSSFVSGYIYESSRISGNRLDSKPGNIHKKNVTLAYFISCMAGLSIIYLFGYFHLLGYLYMITLQASFPSLLIKAFELGVKPFIIIDLLKISGILALVKTIEK
ncbi:MAG: biotin transporter BioY [Actinobacteria bacterium]|nr:biotin transporter BioY [Actinomycetota bacterium]